MSYRPTHSLDYTRCSSNELRGLLMARNLPSNDTNPLTISSMAKLLRQADAQATFRFRDLAGELRNHIYEELLNIKPDDRNCYPEILATSKTDLPRSERHIV